MNRSTILVEVNDESTILGRGVEEVCLKSYLCFILGNFRSRFVVLLLGSLLLSPLLYGGTSKVSFKSGFKEVIRKEDGSKDVYEKNRYNINIVISVKNVANFLDGINENTTITVDFDSEPGETLVIWNNDGTGNSFSKGNVLGNTEYWEIGVGSIFEQRIHDDSQDVILISDDANEIWKNDGKGNFTKTGTLGNDIAELVAIGDINGDGYDDAVLVMNDANEIWLNDGSGNFINSNKTLGSGAPDELFLADINNDGYADAIFVTTVNQVWINNKDNTFSYSNTIGKSSDGDVFAVGDLNGDGYSDVVIEGEDNWEIWTNNQNNTFSKSANVISVDCEDILLGDVDGDGDLDVIAVTESDEGNQIWLNDGTGVFTDSGKLIGTNKDDGYASAVGKFRGNQAVDVILGEGEHADVTYTDYTFDATLSEAKKGEDEEKYNKLKIKEGKGGIARFVDAEDVSETDRPRYKKWKIVTVIWNKNILKINIKGTPDWDEDDNIFDFEDEIDTLKEKVSATSKTAKSLVDRKTNCTVEFNGYKWSASNISCSGKLTAKYKTYKEDGEVYEEKLGTWNVKGTGTLSLVNTTDN